MTAIKCAITGSSGYVGSYFVKRIREQEGLSIDEMGRKKQLNFSLGQQTELPNLKGIDVLIHCAYDFSLIHFNEIYNINVLGTIDLFKHAKNSGVKQIIFISSMSAFPGTKSYYGKAKLLIEARSKELGFIILRPGLIFSEKPSGIFGAISKFIQLSPIAPLIGLGNQLFYPCHLEDLFQLVLLLMKQNYTDYEKPIIAASKEPVTFKKMVKIIASAYQKKVFLLPLPYRLLYLSMKMLEILNIKTGLRSDSLIGAQYYDKSNHNFEFLEKHNLKFRNLDLDGSC